MTLHAARLDRSDRLRRVLSVLEDGGEHSTLEIALRAEVCAVSSAVSELRANGRRIVCRRTVAPATGNPVWLYRLERP